MFTLCIADVFNNDYFSYTEHEFDSKNYNFSSLKINKSAIKIDNIF
jgi:hypothetical protein